MMVIDPHAHILSEEFIRKVRAGTFGPAVSIEQGANGEQIVSQTTVLGRQRRNVSFVSERYYRIDLRLQDMDTLKVDKQILSILPPFMLYGIEAGVNKEIAAVLNESIAEIAQAAPDRFSCMATVPLLSLIHI